MSPLSADRLLVALSPAAVGLFRESGRLRRKRGEGSVLPCPQRGDGPPWAGALAILQGALADPRWRGLPLEITLADRLVRYQLLPWLPELENPAEREGYGRFHFRQVFGALAEDWDIRVDDAPPGAPSVACGTDRALIAALAAAAEAAGTTVARVVPAFAALYNRRRRELAKAGGEVTVLARTEAGGLSYGLIRGGRWLALRQRLAWADTADALQEALEQERLLADPSFDQATVCLAAGGNGAAPGDEPWALRRLALVGELLAWREEDWQ